MVYGSNLWFGAPIFSVLNHYASFYCNFTCCKKLIILMASLFFGASISVVFSDPGKCI